MPRGVQRARLDAAHPGIVQALRQAGICAFSTAAIGNGFPDIVAALRGVNVLLEVKTGSTPSERKLTADERAFHDSWAGALAVVSTPEEAKLAVIEAVREAGRL